MGAKRPPEPPPSSPEAGQMDPQTVETDDRPPASPTELSQTGAECVICTDTITDPCEVRPCAHRPFDYLCVATWLFSDARCPVCRTAVDSLVRDSTGEALTDFQAPTPTLNLHPPSSFSSHPRQPRPRAPLRRRPRGQCRSRYAAPEEPSAALRRRQEVYLHGRYSKHVGSNRLSRYRELTPALFREDEQLVSRARMWIRRELQVFSFLRPDASNGGGGGGDDDQDAASRRRHQNAEFLLEYVVAILKSVDLAGSAGEAENMLSEFLGRDNTRLFLHELRAWLRSPFTKLEDWDRAVQYEVEGSSGPSRREDDRRQEVAGRPRMSHAEETERAGSRRRRFGGHQEQPDKRRRGYDRYVPSSASGSHSRR